MRLRPGEQFLRSGRRGGDLRRVVLDERARRVVDQRDPEALRQTLHGGGCVEVVGHQVRERVLMVGYHLGEKVVLDSGGQAVGARQDKIDLDVAALLLGLQLAGQLGRRCGRVGDVVDDFGMGGLEVLDHPLGQLEVARDVEDVEGDRVSRCAGCGSAGGSPSCGDYTGGWDRSGARAARRGDKPRGNHDSKPFGPRSFLH